MRHLYKEILNCAEKQISLNKETLFFCCSYRYCKNKPYPKSRFCRGVPGEESLEVCYFYLKFQNW